MSGRCAMAMLAILLPLLGGGCGWHAVYATGGTSDAQGGAGLGLSEVAVPLIPERSGQLLRLALQERFERFGGRRSSRYDLAVSFALSNDSIAILQDNTSTRARVVGTADWRLVSQDPQHATLASGTARNVDGYNILNQEFFAADLESESVTRRVADAIADQIASQLAAYFRAHAAAG